MMAYNNGSNCMRVIYRYNGAFLRRIKIGPKKYKYTGIINDIFNIFLSYYNICSVTTYKKRIFLGDFHPGNKTFDGVLGYLQRNEYDVIICSATSDSDRYQYFSHSNFMHISSVGALMGFPTATANYAGFVQIFDYINWITIGCTILAGVITILFLETTTKYFQRNDKDFGTRNAAQILEDGFIVIFGILIGQGVLLRRSKHISSELFISTWLLSTMFLSFFYKTMLLSTLVMPKVHVPFTNVYEMVEQHQVKWHLMSKSQYQIFEGAEPNSTLGKLFTRASGTVSSLSNKELAQKIRSKKIVAIFDDIIIDSEISNAMGQNKTCIFTKMKEPFWSGPRFSFFRKGFNATIKIWFDNTISSMRESGIYDYLYKKNIHPRVYKCISEAEKTRSQVRNLELEDFYAIFALLITGHIFALIIFVLECAAVKWKGINCEVKNF